MGKYRGWTWDEGWKRRSKTVYSIESCSEKKERRSPINFRADTFWSMVEEKVEELPMGEPNESDGTTAAPGSTKWIDTMASELLVMTSDFRGFRKSPISSACFNVDMSLHKEATEPPRVTSSRSVTRNEEHRGTKKWCRVIQNKVDPGGHPVEFLQRKVRSDLPRRERICWKNQRKIAGQTDKTDCSILSLLTEFKALQKSNITTVSSGDRLSRKLHATCMYSGFYFTLPCWIGEKTSAISSETRKKASLATSLLRTEPIAIWRTPAPRLSRAMSRAPSK